VRIGVCTSTLVWIGPYCRFRIFIEVHLQRHSFRATRTTTGQSESGRGNRSQALRMQGLSAAAETYREAPKMTT
jgi:hypothetical protein